MGGKKHPPVDEEDSNKSQFMGAGYRTKQGVINLELGPSGPNSKFMTPHFVLYPAPMNWLLFDSSSSTGGCFFPPCTP